VSDKLLVTWEEIVSICETICKDLTEEGDTNITSIIGISRGGLIPATIIAQMLNVKNVYSVGVRSYMDNGRYDTRLKEPMIYQDITNSQIKSINKNEGITLLVDDISDQGTTLKYIANRYKFDNCRCVSLFMKASTCFIPRYRGVISMKWIVFPWELNN
jgi:hypoxanthine phosphoribosyltransferase